MIRHVVVVGGGISGFAAAFHLRADGVRVTVLESSPQVGGVLRVSEVAGLPVDEGAESLLNRRPEAVDLVRAVGLGGDLTYPAPVGAGLWSRGALRALPGGIVMGVPGDPAGLDGVLAPDEVSAVAADRSMPGLPIEHDVAIGALVADRMGPAVVQRLVEPLLGGVYAGRAEELSLRATVPALAHEVGRHSSLLDAAAAVRAAAPPHEGPVFAGIRGGVGRLPAAVAAASGASVRTGVTVRAITPTTTGWRVETGPAPRPEFIDADGVVLAVPAAATVRLLRDAAPVAATALAGIDQASVAIVTVALRAAEAPAAAGWSGFLVPPIEGRAVKAVTFSTQKWPWLGEQAGDLLVLRASIGRHRQERDLQRPDDDLVAIVVDEIRDALSTEASPVDARVTRWGGALPQYAVGHVERIARADAALAAVPGLAVCGAAFDGVGVAACVARARTSATSVLTDLGAVPLSGYDRRPGEAEGA